MSRSDKVEEIRDFVVKSILNERDRHSRLLNDLSSEIGGTELYARVVETLSKIHEARIKSYELVLEKMKGV